MAKKTKSSGFNDLKIAILFFTGLLAFITAGVIGATSTQYHSNASTPTNGFPTSQWNSAIANVIYADNTQSVKLPSGQILWAFGDTTKINDKSVVGTIYYPHNAFVKQAPNSLNFTPVAGKISNKPWQQVPNWSDDTYFWMATPIVDGGSLYVLGERIKGVVPFSIQGIYVAVFNANTLAYERIVQIPGGSTGKTNWGGVVRTGSGFWISGTHNVSCSNSKNCKVGDMAFVPFGKLASPGSWKVYNNIIPASNNLGTVIALLQNGSTWDVFTKVGDQKGGTQIERLTAGSPTGVWKINGKWDAPSPSGTVTYGVAVHPEQVAPPGQILVSYNVNGVKADYHPRFLYLPK